MSTVTNRIPRDKRAVNLSLTGDVLDLAKELNVNISHVCDVFLADYVRQVREQHWRDTYAGFIEAYNNSLEVEGLPLGEMRMF